MTSLPALKTLNAWGQNTRVVTNIPALSRSPFFFKFPSPAGSFLRSDSASFRTFTFRRTRLRRWQERTPRGRLSSMPKVLCFLFSFFHFQVGEMYQDIYQCRCRAYTVNTSTNMQASRWHRIRRLAWPPLRVHLTLARSGCYGNEARVSLLWTFIGENGEKRNFGHHFQGAIDFPPCCASLSVGGQGHFQGLLS